MVSNNSNFKQTLWKSADKLRDQMDAAEYKHIVLGLIFLKYISDTFTRQKEVIKKMVTDPKSDLFLNENLDDINDKDLEDRDYYNIDNVFWVPESARWESLRAKGKQPDIGSIIDSAMSDIETENKSLKGKLDKRFGRTQLEANRLGELIDLISTIGFTDEQNSGDMLGEVYEYFLGQFASAEGKKGGQFYTSRSIVKTLVEILSPHKGRVYDPCCGSGGMFVHSEDFVTSHGGKAEDISIYGQESNPTTWRLAAMNLAIRGFASDLGKEPADTFARDQHPDVKFDYILANPPFNISDWGGEKYQDDPRWKFGTPPPGNANYAWLQHILWKLAPGGQAGIVLANGSMASNTSGEGDIRKAMIQQDTVEIMISLPSNLFFNVTIPVCLWFLTNDKTKNGRDRSNETLFIDARDLGVMKTRILKVLTDQDIKKIANTVLSWRKGKGYEDIKGFCKSSKTKEIEKSNYALIPGKYVGFKDEETDNIDSHERLKSLKSRLNKLQQDGSKLYKQIEKDLLKISDE